MSRHTYVNINKLIGTMVLLAIPVSILSIVFWKIFPITKVILFSLICFTSIFVFDRLLLWSLNRYDYKTRELVIFLLGAAIAWFGVSNELLPMIQLSLR